MTDTPYNIAPLGLFGKRCRILTGYNKRPFVYRIVNSEWMSNTWCEPPITYQSERNPVRHDHSENVLIVVLDTLIDENSRLIRVALKDVELMDEVQDNAGWISVKERLPEATKPDANGNITFSDYVLTYQTYEDGHHWIAEDTCRVDHGCWMHEVPGMGCKVTHWMPLPSTEGLDET